jgi:small-conductance mechanosensitive channel
MHALWTRFVNRLPAPMQELLDLLLPALQILLIVAIAVLLRHLLRQLIAQMSVRYSLPIEFNVGARRIASFLIYGSALLLILERLGVSGAVLWSALTGFTAVAAVAFFAAWSVLSNIFCSLLVFTTGLFRLGDHIELLENGEKPGLKGRVLDINLIYTTLEESGTPAQGTLIKVPNSLFFQRTVRRWLGPIEADGVLPAKVYHAPPTATPAVTANTPDAETAPTQGQAQGGQTQTALAAATPPSSAG